MTFNYSTFRFTRSCADFPRFKPLFDAWSDNYFVVEETASNVHMHMVLERKKLTHSTLGQQWKKKFPDVTGNGSYASSNVRPKEEDMLKVERYAAKGTGLGFDKITIVHMCGKYTEEYLTDRNREYWEENARLHPIKQSPAIKIDLNRIELGVQKEARIKVPTFMEKCLAHVVQNYPDYEWDMSKQSRDLIYVIVMVKLGNAVKILDPSIVRRMCYGLLNALAPLASQEYLYSQVWGESMR